MPGRPRREPAGARELTVLFAPRAAAPTIVSVKVSILRIIKFFGYALALLGCAVGGFPPPRPFTREELPEEVMERVISQTEVESIDGWESEWGLRVDEPRVSAHLRSPESAASPRR